MQTTLITPFGPMTVDLLLAADSLKGVGRHSSRWQVLEAFIRHSEGRAERICEGSSGLIILVGIPDQPNSGQFYLYDQNTRHIFTLSFETQDTFHSSMFDYVVTFYNLGQWVEVPRVHHMEKRQTSDKTNAPAASQNKAHHNRKRFRKQRRPHISQVVGLEVSPNVSQVANV